ncbi:MAG TPA: ATP-binding protein [Gaiellaceae bacterium]|nr:ATP-binding protein [Gaiellaceae bacterium]
MPSILTSSRTRALAVALIGAAVAAGVQLLFGVWQGWDPVLAVAVGIFVAVVAGVGGGVIAGGVTAVTGSALFVAYAMDDTEIAALAVPAWLAAGMVAGLASDLWWSARREREGARAEVEAIRRAAHAALATVGADSTIAGWNAEAERLFGQPAEAAIGADAALLGRDVGTLLEGALHAGAPVEGTASAPADDGGVAPLRVRAVPWGAASDRAVVVAATDVSEAVRLEDELREVRARDDALRRSLPIVAYVHPPGDRDSLTYISPHVDPLLGYAPDELTDGRLSLGALVHPDDRERVANELKTLAREEPFRAEYRVLARDGRVVPVRDVATTVRDSAGQPLYVQGFLIDFSERVEFQRERERLALARSDASEDALTRQQRLDLVVEASTSLASSLETAAALRRLAELAVRDFADWCVVDLVTEDGALARLTASHAEPINDAQERPGAPEPAPERDVETVARSGKPIVVPPIGEPEAADRDSGRGSESRLVAPMLARGHVVGVLTFVRRAGARRYGADDLAVAMDLARRAAVAIEAERLHRRVEEEADAARVLTYVADGVFLVDRTGIIRLWNPAAEAITGLAAPVMVGRSPADAIRGWDDLRQQIPLATSASPPAARTLSLETPLGERWISIAAVEFFDGTVYAFRDVTEEHQLDELKAEFVATASHELRTPLAAVYGAAQTLRRHDFALDEAGRERFVSMIVEEADRLGRIVNEILLANQLDADRVEPVAEPFDPGELVERVAEATRSHAPPGISLELVVRPAAQVAADRDKVRQVLVNLVDNALKYSPDGGTVELGVEPGDGNVRFYVRDEGLGIPPAEQDRIFEKFYRLDPGMTRGVGGTGLGLYICSQLVERMGGRIWVESSHGEGSTFAFELPAAEPASMERAAIARNGDRERT